MDEVGEMLRLVAVLADVLGVTRTNCGGARHIR